MQVSKNMSFVLQMTYFYLELAVGLFFENIFLIPTKTELNFILDQIICSCRKFELGCILLQNWMI
ncbi:hypothetical protein [Commensalibacter communis]|uniref:hypothetical protein n=1 Tax=Commensalibacter communis TaxID=2972786 RepID=UPI002330F751|nr:hypothetical protein [Commensalibacter communis]